MAASPPKIVGPLGPCSETIGLHGQVRVSTIEVYASFTNLWELIAAVREAVDHRNCRGRGAAPDPPRYFHPFMLMQPE